jgi:hypothetical protein
MSSTVGAANPHTIFECPQCKETIDSSADTCRFCGAMVDHAAAQKAADVLSRVNQAISDAKYMRTCSLGLPVVFALRFVPFFAWSGGIGYLGLSLLVPVWALLWWMKYASLKVDDNDYRNARTTVKICGVVVGLVLLFLIVLPFIFGLILYLTGIVQPTAAAH